MNPTKRLASIDFGGFKNKLVQKNGHDQKRQHGQVMRINKACRMIIALIKGSPGEAGSEQIGD
ncbi:MAG: hypothetical protein BWY72_00396 [Bacteroidetes bacterium ADurb.Bin416]|nr:MAG: hypothetical protein BWY72_00396 [Bacteroidetes bacterium ADurb.Bin416]